jgi:allophanate hydrolase
MSPGSSSETALLTVADWRDEAGRGLGVLDRVRERHARISASPAVAVWIELCSPERLENRLAALNTAAAGLTAAECLARWPLFGVPFAVKDNIDVEGWPTTAACPAWARTASHSANVVRRLFDAGAVLIGKTNLDQFATGLVGTRSPYGAPASAWVAGHVSGGSSSGSAVAVARADVAFSLGSDTAGSGRIPAGFNNIVGLKPTPGRVGTSGVLPACRSIDCVSVFALTVEDAAAVLAIIEGPDEGDVYSRFAPGLAALAARPRVGVPSAPTLDASQGYDAGWAEALGRLAAWGITTDAIDFAPLHAVARELYEGAWVAERYIVVRDLLERDPQALDPTVAAVIGRAKGLSAADAFEGQYALQRGQQWARQLWDRVDLLMVPTAPRHPSFADVAAAPVSANAQLGTYTNFVNLLGWSALALPSGFTPQGFPFGVTLIGPAGADAALARFGLRWQQTAALTLGATDRRWAPPVVALGTASFAAPWPTVEPQVLIAVVGAHLSGMPLNGQLTERRAVLESVTTTAPRYRLVSLPGQTPPKPGLLRMGGAGDTGRAIAVEVWSMPASQVGSFLALIAPPLGLGSIELADGRFVKGFLCEAHAIEGAEDISRFGGWRAWLEHRSRS